VCQAKGHEIFTAFQLYRTPSRIPMAIGRTGMPVKALVFETSLPAEEMACATAGRSVYQFRHRGILMQGCENNLLFPMLMITFLNCLCHPFQTLFPLLG